MHASNSLLALSRWADSPSPKAPSSPSLPVTAFSPLPFAPWSACTTSSSATSSTSTTSSTYSKPSHDASSSTIFLIDDHHHDDHHASSSSSWLSPPSAAASVATSSPSTSTSPAPLIMPSSSSSSSSSSVAATAAAASADPLRSPRPFDHMPPSLHELSGWIDPGTAATSMLPLPPPPAAPLLFAPSVAAPLASSSSFMLSSPSDIFVTDLDQQHVDPTTLADDPTTDSLHASKRRRCHRDVPVPIPSAHALASSSMQIVVSVPPSVLDTNSSSSSLSSLSSSSSTSPTHGSASLFPPTTSLIAIDDSTAVHLGGHTGTTPDHNLLNNVVQSNGCAYPLVIFVDGYPYILQTQALLGSQVPQQQQVPPQDLSMPATTDSTSMMVDTARADLHSGATTAYASAPLCAPRARRTVRLHLPDDADHHQSQQATQQATTQQTQPMMSDTASSSDASLSITVTPPSSDATTVPVAASSSSSCSAPSGTRSLSHVSPVVPDPVRSKAARSTIRTQTRFATIGRVSPPTGGKPPRGRAAVHAAAATRPTVRTTAPLLTRTISPTVKIEALAQVHGDAAAMIPRHPSSPSVSLIGAESNVSSRVTSLAPVRAVQSVLPSVSSASSVSSVSSAPSVPAPLIAAPNANASTTSSVPTPTIATTTSAAMAPSIATIALVAPTAVATTAQRRSSIVESSIAPFVPSTASATTCASAIVPCATVATCTTATVATCTTATVAGCPAVATPSTLASASMATAAPAAAMPTSAMRPRGVATAVRLLEPGATPIAAVPVSHVPASSSRTSRRRIRVRYMHGRPLRAWRVTQKFLRSQAIRAKEAVHAIDTTMPMTAVATAEATNVAAGGAIEPTAAAPAAAAIAEVAESTAQTAKTEAMVCEPSTTAMATTVSAMTTTASPPTLAAAPAIATMATATSATATLPPQPTMASAVDKTCTRKRGRIATAIPCSAAPRPSSGRFARPDASSRLISALVRPDSSSSSSLPTSPSSPLTAMIPVLPSAILAAQHANAIAAAGGGAR